MSINFILIFLVITIILTEADARTRGKAVSISRQSASIADMIALIDSNLDAVSNIVNNEDDEDYEWRDDDDWVYDDVYYTWYTSHEHYHRHKCHKGSSKTSLEFVNNDGYLRGSSNSYKQNCRDRAEKAPPLNYSSEHGYNCTDVHFLIYCNVMDMISTKAIEVPTFEAPPIELPSVEIPHMELPSTELPSNAPSIQ